MRRLLLLVVLAAPLLARVQADSRQPASAQDRLDAVVQKIIARAPRGTPPPDPEALLGGNLDGDRVTTPVLRLQAAVGELQVDIGGSTVARVPLYPRSAVPEGNLWRRLVDTVSLWF